MPASIRRFEPTVQLDCGLIIPASAAAGKVLTSDASGNATWQTGAGAQYAATFGDGVSTSYTITHNLGTRDVDVNVYQAATPYNAIQCGIANATLNTVTLTFVTAPAANSLRAIVQAGGSSIIFPTLPTVWTDELQPGYIGNVNTGPITAAINAGTAALTFTNWPVGDVAYFMPPAAGSPLIRSTVPVAPTTITCPTTAGMYSYVYVLLGPTVNGVATLGWSIGTPRASAALAAADAQGAAATTTGLLIWDGIVLNTGGVYSLVTSGLFQNASGRDRRPWARGAQASVALAFTTNSLTWNGSGWTGLAFPQLRVECSGQRRLKIRLGGGVSLSLSQAGAWAYIAPFIDNGDAIPGSDLGQHPTAGYWSPVDFTWEYQPTAGSHFFLLAGHTTGSGATATISFLSGSNSLPGVAELRLSVEEMPLSAPNGSGTLA